MEGAYNVSCFAHLLTVIAILMQIFTPILHWIDGKNGPAPKPVPYPYGSRGPKELDSFIAKYGYKRTVPE